MPPLTMMSPSQVEGVLTSLEREGKIPHNWRWTWTEAHKVRVAHSVYDSPEMLKWSGRAEEWRNLGAEVGGPLAGGAQWWALRETHPRPEQPQWLKQRQVSALEQPAAEAPWPIQTLGATTGWVATETGLRVGTTAPKVLKRGQLGQQPYILPVDRPAVTSWLHAPGTPPERGAEVMTAFMHGLPPGAGAVSPAFPELSERYTKYIPVTAGAEITAMARPGAWAKRGGALELLRTTTGITREAVSDWERVQLTGRPELVPYRGGEAWRFELERFTPAQAGTISQKAMMVKAFMGTGYDPQKMFPGMGVEQILPWPKEPRGFMAGMLGTQYGRQWFQQYLMGMEEKQPGILREQYGIPYQLGFGKPAIPREGMEWGTKYDPLLVQAGQRFIGEHTAVRKYPIEPVHESLLGTRRGGVWTEKLGSYWEFMPKGMAPEPLGEGRYRIWQEQAVLAAPLLSQYRREWAGEPFVSREELQHLAMTDRPFAERLWREGAEARSPYMQTYRAIAATRAGGFQGAIPMTQLPWGRIQERAEQLQTQELGWRPEGQRVPGQYLARAMAQIEPGPVSVPYGKKQFTLPGAGALERFGAPGPLGEEVTPVMTSWHRLVEQAAMQFAPGGVQMGDPRAYQRAGMETFRELHRLATGAGFRREATGTHPRSAWEGPILAHTGLAPGEAIMGDIALQEAYGAQTPEDWARLQQEIRAGQMERGPVAEMWRRPLSDIFGQMGLRAGVMTEEMAREKGFAVSGLGRGMMVSPTAMFAGRGDLDADRLIAVMRNQLKQLEGKPVFGPVAGLMQRGLGTVEKLAESLRLHSPEETPAGSPLAQMWGSTAKWNEARAWAEEIQSMGRMPQVMEFFAGAQGPEVSWGQIAQGVQAGLTAKEMMGRSYNRLIRELRPQMMGSIPAQQFYRQMAAGPYQSTIDVTALSEGSRKYFEMQESLSMTPKGGSYWMGRTFSPYKLSEETGRYEPEYLPMKGWPDIGRHLVGAISGMEEIPLTARAYGIGGEKYHQQVLQALQAGAQPAEVMGLMGGTEEEALLRGGPMIQATMRRLYSKMGEGEQTYTTRAGEERTVTTEWGGATPQARGLRTMGQKVRTMLQFFSRRERMTPYQVQGAVSGGMPEAPGTDWLTARLAREMGLSEEQAAQVIQPSAYETQKAQDAPVVAAMNAQWEAEIRQRMAEQAPGGMGTPDPYTTAMYTPPRQWTAASIPQGPSDARLRAAIAAGRGGGGGVPPPMAPPVAEPLPEWRGMQGWQEQMRITRGPGGISTTQMWTEPVAARGWDIKALERIEAGTAQYGPEIYKATDALANKFQELNRIVEEGLPLRKEEVKGIKGTIRAFTEARQLAEEWERQARRTYTMTGTEEFEAQRARVRGVMGPMIGAVEEGRVQQRIMEMQMAGIPTVAGGGGAPPSGIGGRIGAWLEGQAPAGGGRGFWSGMGALGWGMMNMQRVWRYTGGQVGQWMGQYAGYELAAQQAGFALGQGGGGLTGAPADILTYQAQMQNMQTGLGRSAWQNWGWMYGALGTQTTESTVAGRGLTAALGAAAPYGMLRGAGWIAGSMGQPALAGALGLGATAAGVAGAALGGVWAGGEIAGAIGPTVTPALTGLPYRETEPGLGGTLGAIWRYGRETAFVGMHALGMAGETQEQQENLLRYMFPEDFAEERREQRRQEFMAQRGPRTVEEVARFYGGKGGPLATMPEQQIVQMLGVLGGLTGTGLQYWQPGGAGEGIVGRLGAQAQLMGYQGPAQYGSALLQLTERMGAMPGSQEMLRLLQQFSQVSNQTQFYQLQAAAPVMGQMMEMFGQVPGGELGFAQRYAEQMTAPERRRMQQLLGGNRLLWSDIGRQQGRPELITMEEGGLPIFTTEMRGLQDVQSQQQRAYRDWQAQQQWTQMQATQAYTRGMWGLEDRQRALQYQQADWLYGFQQQQFGVAGRQWYERFDVQGRQQMESMALGRQVFEARVGYQAADISRQRERAGQQYQWRMEDWTYSENMAQLRYGWQMEDLSESIRFATGRERRGLMRQQERTTIAESMRREHSEEQRDRMEEQRQWEQEDFELSKQRNEELIALQREQYEMQKRHWEEDREIAQRHFEEDREMQQEQIEKQREFYLQSRELDEERIQRQREYWEQQQQWAEEAWKRTQDYNREMDKLQEQYKQLQRQQEDVVANFQRMLTYTEELAGAFTGWLNQSSASVKQNQEWTETQRGHQLGGYIEQNEIARLHGGEYVVPRHGQLVIKGEDSKSLALFEQMIALLGRIAAASEHGQQSMVIVQTPDAQRAREHVLGLEDQAYALWPS